MTAKQGPPDPSRSYTKFPSHDVVAGEVMYRAHGAHGAWYFAFQGGGRFDLRRPRGTCYTAVDVRTAVREKLRDAITDGNVVTYAQATSFRVSRVTSAVEYRCADVCANEAENFGVVREIATVPDYTIPQQWAEAFVDAGFNGVFYGSAYTTGDTNAYALFGDAGPAPAGAGFDEAEHLTGVEACIEIGLHVEGMPAMGDVTLI